MDYTAGRATVFIQPVRRRTQEDQKKTQNWKWLKVVRDKCIYNYDLIMVVAEERTIEGGREREREVLNIILPIDWRRNLREESKL